MDQIAHESNKSSSRSSKQRQNTNRPARPNVDRRYSARYLILIYSQTSARFDPLEIQRLASRQQAKCTIVRQSLLDSTFNYFAFVDFVGKRFQTRNLKCFDIQGYHPKWLHLTSSPWRNLDQMIERGEVVWNGVSRPTDPTGTRETLSSSKKTSSSLPMQWDLLGSTSNEASFLDLCENWMPKETFDDFTKILQQPVHSRHNETEISRNVRYWQDGFRAGYEAGLSVSNRQTDDTISVPE